MSPLLLSVVEARGKRLALVPIMAAGLGLLMTATGAMSALRRGAPDAPLFIGIVLLVAGIILFVRGRNAKNDPVYKVLSQPQNVTAMKIVETHGTVGGASVMKVFSVVISHSGGRDVWLPVRGVPVDNVVADLRALCPQAKWG